MICGESVEDLREFPAVMIRENRHHHGGGHASIPAELVIGVDQATVSFAPEGDLLPLAHQLDHPSRDIDASYGGIVDGTPVPLCDISYQPGGGNRGDNEPTAVPAADVVFDETELVILFYIASFVINKDRPVSIAVMRDPERSVRGDDHLREGLQPFGGRLGHPARKGAVEPGVDGMDPATHPREDGRGGERRGAGTGVDDDGHALADTGREVPDDGLNVLLDPIWCGCLSADPVPGCRVELPGEEPVF